MIVLDTDFLSSMTKIHKLELLSEVFGESIIIPEGVYKEIKESPVFDKLIRKLAGKEIKVEKVDQ